MTKIYIVAGTRAEFERYVRNKMQTHQGSNRDFVYVDGVHNLRGVSSPHGFYIGSWRNRADIVDIQQQILIAQAVRSPVRPTPKVTATQAVQLAADDLARAIDQEVLTSLMQTSTMTAGAPTTSLNYPELIKIMTNLGVYK